MRLYFHQTPQGNFGDDINKWLWHELLGIDFDQSQDRVLVGIGTIFDKRIPAAKTKIIMGSGVGYGPVPDIHCDNSYDIRFVRGPKSCQALGLDSSKGITDAAYLVRDYVEAPEKKYACAYIPHVTSAINADWQKVCDKAGLHYIDPRADSKEVIRQIAASTRVITEAMHGAIIADTYRVPWLPVTAYDHILEFKWLDYCQSVELPYLPQKIGQLWHPCWQQGHMGVWKNRLKSTLKSVGLYSSNWSQPLPPRSGKDVYRAIAQQLLHLAASNDFFLSADHIYQQRREQLQQQIAKLRAELKVAVL